MKDREAILKSRWIRPFAHLFGHPSLWHLNRRSVPRALAVGLFAAFIIPIGQFALAALIAVPTRANVPLAAASTLVTNPLTFPAFYLAAYKVGDWILERPAETGGELAPGLDSMILAASAPTALGLIIFAVLGAATGYLIGTLWWRLRLIRRWRDTRADMTADRE